MKYLFFSISVTLLFLFNSCNDWLDVNPRSETKSKVLFKTEDGFKSALTGVYIKLASPDLYGRNTSMYLPEALARHWTIPEFTSGATSMNNTLNMLSKFDYTYTDSENLLTTVWLGYYNSIVQLNDILENLETTSVDFRYNNDKLIKGEALGLRAFIHLEVLRFFGPVPDAGVDMNGMAIPYVTEMTKDPNKLVSKSYKDILTLIEKDLNEAEKLLEIDPILTNSNDQLNGRVTTGENIPEDSWQRFRQNRFNYYAVLGSKARFYHWIGDKKNAADYALQVIDAVNEDGNGKFVLAEDWMYTNAGITRSLVMSTEHLFSVHNPDLQAVVQPLFKDAEAIFRQSVAAMNTAYESTIHQDDIRYKPLKDANRYWEESTYQNSKRVNHFRKYTGNNNIDPDNIVPLLRLSEMYFIVIEDLPLGQIDAYFNKYRNARILSTSIDGTLTSEDAVLARLQLEYRKEFFGEGQMFFFYKRHNVKDYTWPSAFTLPGNAYVVPKPKGQLAFE